MSIANTAWAAGGKSFAATRWTLVLRASGDSGESRAALSELCEAYYSPVVAFLRRTGRAEDEARELAHEFFARLLERGGFAEPDPARGRFRNYLLAALRYFLRDRYEHARREKRGGGAAHESLDAEEAEVLSVELACASGPADAAAFDREWAVAIMNRAVAALESQYAGERAEQFAVLRPWLMGEGTISHAEAAERLGMSEGAVKVAVHRMRQRFREVLKMEIAQTLADPRELEDELRHLCAALANGV